MDTRFDGAESLKQLGMLWLIAPMPGIRSRPRIPPARIVATIESVWPEPWQVPDAVAEAVRRKYQCKVKIPLKLRDKYVETRLRQEALFEEIRELEEGRAIGGSTAALAVIEHEIEGVWSAVELLENEIDTMYE